MDGTWCFILDNRKFADNILQNLAFSKKKRTKENFCPLKNKTNDPCQALLVTSMESGVSRLYGLCFSVWATVKSIMADFRNTVWYDDIRQMGAFRKGKFTDCLHAIGYDDFFQVLATSEC